MGDWIQGASGIWMPKVWMDRPNKLEPETLVYLTSHTDASRDWWNIDQNLKSIKYGSGITLNALTCNLSTVDGTAFVTNPSVDLRPYLGFKLSFSDGIKALVGYGKAAGTGETLGSNRILNNADFSTAEPDGTAWTRKTGWTVAGGVAVASEVALSGSILQSASTLAVEKLYKYGGDVVTITLGSFIYMFDTGIVALSATPQMYSGYRTYTANSNSSGFQSVSASSSGTFDNPFVKQVLSPSTTGLTVVSTQGGATYNWASNGGINANSASYTVTITKE